MSKPVINTEQQFLSLDHSRVWRAFCDEANYGGPFQFLVAKAQGFYVTDISGHQYFDASSGLWNVILGYGRAELIEAITAQLRTLCSCHLFGMGHLPAARLAEELLTALGPPFARITYVGSGSEAVDTSLKICRQYQRLRG